MTNGKKARTERKANPQPVKEKVVTPWFLRDGLMLRKGRGNELHEAAGTPVSAKRVERLAKMYDGVNNSDELTLA